MIKKNLIILLFLMAMVPSYFYGLISYRDRLAPYPQILYVRDRLFPERIGFSDTTSRSMIPCGDIRGGRVMVALAFGQSNSGNHGETRYRPEQPVYNFFRGRCYRAEDPLLGATGDRGSVWTRLGDLLIRQGLYDRVVIIPIGVGTTTIDQWTAGEYLHRRIIRAIRESGEAGLPITHMFWVQGGSEPRSDRSAANRGHYRDLFLSMLKSIRDLGVGAPVYVAVSTFNDTGFIRDIQEAQRRLVDPAMGIRAGPDTDIFYLDLKNIWETVHLSHAGLDASARAWLSAIRKAEGR